MNTIPFTSHFVNLAVKEARKSSYVMQLGCIIFKGKSVIAKGYNRSEMWTITKNIPMKYLKWKGSLHAEMSAVFSALEKKKSLQGASLLVIRINKEGQFRYAKPCIHCQLGIAELTPIKKVYYSIDSYPYIIKGTLAPKRGDSC